MGPSIPFALLFLLNSLIQVPSYHLHDRTDTEHFNEFHRSLLVLHIHILPADTDEETPEEKSPAFNELTPPRFLNRLAANPGRKWPAALLPAQTAIAALPELLCNVWAVSVPATNALRSASPVSPRSPPAALAV